MTRKLNIFKSKPLPFCEHYAGQEKHVLKAIEIQQSTTKPFDITIDLEDGIGGGEAQSQLDSVLNLYEHSVAVGTRVGIRSRHPKDPFWLSQVQQLIEHCGNKIAYITLPKLSSEQQAMKAISHIKAISNQCQLTDAIPIHILIENQQALNRVWQIAEIDEVETLDFGLIDFVASYQGAIPASAMQSPGQFDNALVHRAKTEISAACHSNAVIPSHCIAMDMTYDAAYRDAHLAKQMYGYQRMYSIHPSQIEAIVDAMSPSEKEVDAACEILSAAKNAEWAPINWQGQLFDMATYRYHQSILQAALVSGFSFENSVQELLP